MAKIKVEFVEVKEGVSDRGPWKKYDATVTNLEDNKEIKLSSFDELQAGREYEGEITVKGQFTNFKKAVDPNVMGPKPACAKKDNGIAKAMDRKEAGIAKTMDRKENGMLLSGSQRDATMVALAQLTGKNFTDEEYKFTYEKWRTYYINSYGDPEDLSETKSPDFNNY